MITLGTMFVGIAVALLSYNCGIEHARAERIVEEKKEFVPVSVDEVMDSLEKEFEHGDD